jgi:DNA invertase Pin-like site-specific DNA recombinase
MKYGYARVSSKAQDYAAQVEALKAAGCGRIFSEKASGKSTNGRPEFAKLLKALLPGDTVVVTKLDRLARSKHSASTERALLRLRIAWGKLVRHDYRCRQADADHHRRYCGV